MSDPSPVANGPALSGHPPYDRPPGLALAELPADVRARWRDRYVAQPEAELRVQSILDRAEAALVSAGGPVTIRTLWMALLDSLQGREGNADLRAATALAGMALGLRPS